MKSSVFSVSTVPLVYFVIGIASLLSTELLATEEVSGAPHHHSSGSDSHSDHGPTTVTASTVTDTSTTVTGSSSMNISTKTTTTGTEGTDTTSTTGVPSNLVDDDVKNNATMHASVNNLNETENTHANHKHHQAAHGGTTSFVQGNVPFISTFASLFCIVVTAFVLDF